MGPYRLLFLDIDGTLVGKSGRMSAVTLDTLHKVQRQGCILVLCTGRGREATRRVAEQIGGHGYVIVLNGALVFDWETGAILRRSLLPLPIAREAVHIARRSLLAPIWLGTEERDLTLYTDHHAPLVPRYQARNASRLAYVSDLAADIPFEPASIVAYGAQPRTQALAEDWREVLGRAVRAFAAPTAGYGCWYAQLTIWEADKSLAAEAVARALGIPQSETMAIGDHVNDRDLLRWAGLGVSMGDGDLELRAAADHVTGAVEDDGAAMAIRRFVLTGREEERPE